MMPRASLVLALLGLTSSALSAPQQPQTPFSVPPPALPVPSGDAASYGFTRADGSFDTSALLITSINAHLKSWHSALAPNGFSVVPATIPTGTIMYHVRRAGPPPTDGFDWFALDAEHSYLFAGHGGEATMWHFASTRPLKVLYFDGSSAAKSRGPIDVQEIIAYNRTLSNEEAGGGMNDFTRYAVLCPWAIARGIDGFVREESTFEYVHCDFTGDGMGLVRGVNMTVKVSGEDDKEGRRFPGPPGGGGGPPGNGIVEEEDDEPPKGPGGPPERGPGGGKGPRGPRGGESIYSRQTGWQYQRATTWHHHVPQPGVLTHPEHLLSFYDPKYTSLSSVVDLPRASHNLVNLSSADSLAFRTELDTMLDAWTSGTLTSSGVNWKSVVQAATDRYRDHLAELREVLANRTIAGTPQYGNTTATVDLVRLVTFNMLLPYLSGPDVLSVYPAPPTMEERAKAVKEAEEACKGGYTSFLKVDDKFTATELVIKTSLESVLAHICSLTSRTLLHTLNLIDSTPSRLEDHELVNGLLDRTEVQVDALMEWLGWPGWVRCERQCRLDEICLIKANLWEPEPDYEPRCRSRKELTEGRGWP